MHYRKGSFSTIKCDFLIYFYIIWKTSKLYFSVYFRIKDTGDGKLSFLSVPFFPPQSSGRRNKNGNIWGYFKNMGRKPRKVRHSDTKTVKLNSRVNFVLKYRLVSRQQVILFLKLIESESFVIFQYYTYSSKK